MPSAVTLMLPGLRSRWMMPFSCAASSAEAIWRARAQRLLERKTRRRTRALREHLGKRLTLDELHHQVIGADVVQRADVGMIQRRHGAGFALEAFREALVGHLDRDVAAEAGIPSAIHDAHAAGTDLGRNLVGTYARTDVDFHTVVQDAPLRRTDQLPTANDANSQALQSSQLLRRWSPQWAGAILLRSRHASSLACRPDRVRCRVETGGPVSAPIDWTAVDAETLRHFQALVRMDTSDPPGGEKPAADYVKSRSRTRRDPRRGVRARGTSSERRRAAQGLRP